ncbi:MAG TPA: hydroxyacylglutathione hydrolase [Hyphomonadaceae bacterium]|nr:hydroxyacylglutathione hydrolase [Hyphomonadaceae bacterium]
MAAPIIHQFPCLKDNYGFLLHDPDTGETACIDTPEADRILAEAKSKGWTITQIWNTHWHPDHAGGNQAIKDATGCRIVGPKGEAAKIPTLERQLVEGDTVELGSLRARVLETPGHTAGHIVYHLPDHHIAFVGDTLFALGCGRLFEGTPQQMWTSLGKLRAMPDDTAVYCAHEYTQANANFALSVDAGNADLQAYADEVKARRAKNIPTVPTTMGREKKANPFLRADDPKLQAFVGHAGDAIATFAEVRERKNRF